MSASGQQSTSRMQKSKSLIIGRILSKERIREARAKGSVRPGGAASGKRRVGLDRVVAIDWSGDASAAGQRRKIWAGIWTAGRPLRLESGRTRAELVYALIAMARETPRMVVGV